MWLSWPVCVVAAAARPFAYSLAGLLWFSCKLHNSEDKQPQPNLTCVLRTRFAEDEVVLGVKIHLCYENVETGCSGQISWS